MNRINLTLILAGLAFSAQAKAAIVPVKIPALQAPVMLSGSAAAPMAASLSFMPASPLLPAPMLPSPSLPVPGPRYLPGVWNHLPVELPAEAAVVIPAHDEYHLDWSFLDGGHEAAQVAIPVSPAPKPLAPAGAFAQLAFAADEISHEIAVAVFDGAHAFVASVR